DQTLLLMTQGHEGQNQPAPRLAEWCCLRSTQAHPRPHPQTQAQRAVPAPTTLCRWSASLVS
ncbi:MAG: hypothetical protein ACOVLE_15790, partial [Pirellula staleyi]